MTPEDWEAFKNEIMVIQLQVTITVRTELVGVKVADVVAWGALREIMFLNGMQEM